MTRDEIQTLYAYVTRSDELLNRLRANGYVPRHFRRTIATCEELKLQADVLKTTLKRELES